MKEETGKQGMSGGRALKAVLFLTLLAICLYACQEVFTNRFQYPDDTENHFGRLLEFDTLQEDTVDAVFLGTSHVMYGVSPMDIYEDSGIVTYTLASSSQRMDLSCALLEKIFERQKPKVVMLDASSLFLEPYSDYSWRRVLDCFTISSWKLGAAAVYAESAADFEPLSLKDGWQDLTEEAQERLKSFISAVCPLYYYHGRWDELKAEGDSPDGTPSYSKGYQLVAARVVPGDTVEEMNEIADVQSKEEASEAVADAADGWDRTDAYGLELYVRGIEILHRMEEICRDHGAELVLFKVPVVSDPRTYSSSWIWKRSETVKKLAAEEGLRFFDILYDRQDFEYPADGTIDGGHHMNYLGAEIVAKELAAYLRDSCGLPSRENEQYEQALSPWKRATAAAQLQLTYSLSDYLEDLNEQKADITILCASAGDGTGWLNEEECALLKELGISSRLGQGSAGVSFAACISAGKVLLDVQSNGTLTGQSVTLADGKTAVLQSGGSLDTVKKPGFCSIVIGTEQCAMNAGGLNIAVYDNDTGLLIDSAAFSDRDGEHTAARNTGSEFSRLKRFEYRLYERQKAQGL